MSADSGASSQGDDQARLLLAAYERFIDEIVALLEKAAKPDPQAAPSHTVLFALLLKVVRLARSLRGLVLTRHGRETGPNLRSLLQAYVNVKFVVTSGNVEGASVRFLRHLENVRANLEPHLVREDDPGSAFPVMTKEQWKEDEAQNAERRREADEWMTDHGVVELERARIFTDQKGRPLRPLDTWTGLSDRELFVKVGEPDAWRYYVLFSDESHVNAGGIGGLIKEVNKGDAHVSDDQMWVPPLGLAAKYVRLTTLLVDEQFSMGLSNDIEAAFERWSAAFIAAVGTPAAPTDSAPPTSGGGTHLLEKREPADPGPAG